MAGKNKRGRAVRKAKQPVKPKPAKGGTDAEKIDRQANCPTANSANAQPPAGRSGPTR